MSFHLDPPGFCAAGDPALRELSAYLTRAVDRLNYALGFLDLPDAAPAPIPAGAENRVAAIGAGSTHAQAPSAKAVFDYAVPQTRTVNGKALGADVTLSPGDVGAAPLSRKINGHTLAEDVTLTAEELGAEKTENRVNAIGSDATDETYPSAKAVFGFAKAADRVSETAAAGQWRRRIWLSGAAEWLGAGIGVPVPADGWRQFGADSALYAAEAKIPLPADGPRNCAVFVTPAGGGPFAVLGAYFRNGDLYIRILADEEDLPDRAVVNVILAG